MAEKKRTPRNPRPPTPQDTPSSKRRPARQRPTARSRSRTPAPRRPAAARRTSPKTRATSVEPGPLSIVVIGPEAHPFAKTGGLAEVTSALSDALARLGHTVTLVMPRYRGIDVSDTEVRPAAVHFGRRVQEVVLRRRRLGERRETVFVDAPDLFDREGLYGTGAGDYPDNAWRFAVFCRAALECIRLSGSRPSVIHIHDWQTGLVPVYQKMHLSNDPVVGGVPVVLTIHNLAFQGIFPSSVLPDIGLGWEVLDLQAMEYWGEVSYLKAGINFSERITTVSPTYAREILRPELGFGFDGVLARRSADLVGILNGIDVARWDPARDPSIPAPFSAEDLSGKRQAKRALLETAGLPSDDDGMARPVVGMISRLTDQKGLDLFAAAADGLMSLDAAWVLLGSGEARYEALWRTLAARHADRVASTIGFDERLAHVIEAGSDLFLMPSRFEPCGLNQMYSLRYGTVPVVRATGGLADTVEDLDEAKGIGTGFVFHEYSPRALLSAVERALRTYADRDAWTRLQQEGMRRDHSWDRSAPEYVKVYGGAGARPG